MIRGAIWGFIMCIGAVLLGILLYFVQSLIIVPIVSVSFTILFGYLFASQFFPKLLFGKFHRKNNFF